MHHAYPDGLSFNQLGQATVSLVRFLLSKWLILFLAGLLGGLAGIGYAVISKPEYSGKLTFVLSGEAESGGLSSLAGQIGLDLGGSKAAFSGDNIIELFKSRKIIERTLLRRIPEVNKSILNYYVEKNELHLKWQSKERLKGAYPFPDSASHFTPLQDSLVRDVINDLKRNNISVSRLDKKLVVYDVETLSDDQLISAYITDYLTEETARFYIEIKTKSARENLQMIKKEADSLASLLGGTIRYTATETDRTLDLNPALQIQRSSGQLAQSKASVLGLAYGEVVKHLEIAKINLQKETPLFQIIDNPTLPLKIKKPGKLKSAVLFSFVVVFITILFLIVRKNTKTSI